MTFRFLHWDRIENELIFSAGEVKRKLIKRMARKIERQQSTFRKRKNGALSRGGIRNAETDAFIEEIIKAIWKELKY